MTEPDEVPFPLVGVWRMIRAFPERAVNPLWWLGLISGILRVFGRLWAYGRRHRDRTRPRRPEEL